MKSPLNQLIGLANALAKPYLLNIFLNYMCLKKIYMHAHQGTIANIIM